MATLKKLDKNLYEVRWDGYDHEGKRHQGKRHFARKYEADAFLLSIETGETARVKHNLTVSEYADMWWENYKHTLEATSASSYARIVERIKKQLGKTLLTKVKPSDIDRFYIALADPKHPLTKQPLSAATIQRHHAVLKIMFRFAVRDDMIKVNPMDKITPPRPVVNEIEIPDLDTVKARLMELRDSDLYTGVCIAFFTGMRRSDVLGLKWDDVNLEAGQIAVRRVRIRLGVKALKNVTLNMATRKIDIPGLEGWIERDGTKSKHNRIIKAPDALLPILRAAQTEQKKNRLKYGQHYIKSDYVCVHEDGMPISDNELSKSMQGVCRLHDLRHLNVTYLLDAGHAITEIARRVGHTSPSTTLKVYSHVINKQDAEAAESINSAFSFEG